MLDAAKKELALEVSYFLYKPDFMSERWIGYRNWISSLTPKDTIITFNYDECIERLADSRHEKFDQKLKQIAVPTPNTSDEDINRWSKLHPMLLKLHGSTNWDKNGNEVARSEGMPYIIRDTSSLPFIAVPGRDKAAKARDNSLWKLARHAIKRASCIHIVGYRFPDNDFYAFDWIMNSIDQPGPRIDIVLGSGNTSDEDRVKSMIGPIGNCFEQNMNGEKYIWHEALKREKATS